jgi:hypothetical protein
VKANFRMIAVLAVSLMGSALVPALKADEWHKETKITIDQSIVVQGTVLPPGSYVMRLAGSPDERAVEIFNGDANHLITVVLASPAYRLVPTGDSEFTFYKGVVGQPPALRTWFYPGDNFGFEFSLGRGKVGQNATTAGDGGR